MPVKPPENIQGDRIIIGPPRLVRIDELGRDTLRQNGKLPPDHRPTPRFTTIPKGESLPKKK